MKLVCMTKEEVAKDVANRILSLVEKKTNCVLGLATGSTPIESYNEIIKGSKERGISFQGVTTFNLDEYVNNNDFSQSYRYFMDSHLFDFIDIKKENTNFPPENDPSSYDEKIRKAGGIDFQILGIGSDGHIAFNEPGTPFDSKTHIADLKEETIKDNSRFFASIDDVPTQAVTMGLSTIMEAREIVLLAFGKNKAKAVKAMFENPDISCPASILNRHDNVTVFCDKEAMELLSK